jgi:hypothetical protein
MGKLELREELKKSYLIQRLEESHDFDNPFSFGGGLQNGGLSKEAMKLLKNIFSFSYMGSSEFEWGAVPEALNFLGNQAYNKNLVFGNIDDVYYICPKSYEEEVKDRILKLKKDEYQFRLKEHCGLQAWFEDNNKYSKRTLGWIELDNGFMFFVDKNMFEKTCNLFEL